jgi:hypothetical protein
VAAPLVVVREGLKRGWFTRRVKAGRKPRGTYYPD